MACGSRAALGGGLKSFSRGTSLSEEKMSLAQRSLFSFQSELGNASRSSNNMVDEKTSTGDCLSCKVIAAATHESLI